MAAELIEGVAGSGKTTYIANYVVNYGPIHKTLLITFSRTGRDVLKKYLEDRQVDPNHYAIHTIDGLATRFLYELGDNYSVLKRDIIARDLMPRLLDDVLQAWPMHQEVLVPVIGPHTMNALLEDIEFFRATGLDAEASEDEIEQIVAPHIQHDWRLVQRLMWAYDRFRSTWLAPEFSTDDNYEELGEELPWRRGEQGFRQLGDAIDDLLRLVQDTDKLAQWGRRYHLMCIDEFHDTSPLQWQFLLGLARGVQDVMAVGDRFQNIYAWRGTNTAYVFEEFVQQLHAQRKELNHSYRYAQSVADISSRLIQRDIRSQASHTTKITLNQLTDLNKLSKETVLICQDPIAQVQAAFYLWRHSKHKISHPINHSLGPAILNLLICLRYVYLLDARSPILKNLKLDVARFLSLPHCLLSEVATQEILKKPTPDTLAMYFSIHLKPPAQGQQPAYSESMRVSLLQWLSENRETQTVYEIMQWFEQSTRLWSQTDLSMAGAVAQASWQALKEDARDLLYTLAQWPERFEQLNRSWSERAGIRIRTVAQAKGREYDEVLVFNADKQGFIYQGLHTQNGELARNQYYIAITRAKKKLGLLTLGAESSAHPTEPQDVASNRSSNRASNRASNRVSSNASSRASDDGLNYEGLKSGQAGRASGAKDLKSESVLAHTGQHKPDEGQNISDDQPLKRQALAELAQIKAKLLKRTSDN